MKNSENISDLNADKKNSNGNINDWAEALRGIDSHELSMQLNEKRSVGFDNLEKLDLPRYKKKTMPLDNFLKNPGDALLEVQSDLFYITLLPKIDGLSRFSHSGINGQQVLEYVKENISQDAVNNYDIVIQQYFKNLYGGNIIVNSDGQALVEFAAGKQSPIAKGSKNPEFFVGNDGLTNSFKYSFEDESLRKTIYQMIQTIPHEGESRETKYRPGYYEFILVKKDEESPAEPIFIDYKEINSSYRLHPEQK
jgi:hypothetical protein